MFKPKLNNRYLIAVTTLTLASVGAGLASSQTPPNGLRPPLSTRADWMSLFELNLIEGPQDQAIDAVGDRIERHIAAPPSGQELMLFRTEYARRFENELATLRIGTQQISKEYGLETGIGQEVLQLSDGRVRVIEYWMTPQLFIRAAVATAPSLSEAMSLISYVAQVRRKGLYGGMPLLHSPSIAQ